MALPGLIDSLAQMLAWTSLLWLSMTVTKVLDTEIFPDHNIAGLISGIAFIVLFSQEKPLQWKEIYTHTYTFIFYKVSSVKVKMLKS